MAGMTPAAQQLYLLASLHQDGLLPSRTKALLKGLILGGDEGVRDICLAASGMPLQDTADKLFDRAVEAARGIFDAVFEDVPASPSSAARNPGAGSGLPALAFHNVGFRTFAHILRGVHTTAGCRLLDLGSGVGRPVITAALLFDFTACVGLEVDPKSHAIAAGRPAALAKAAKAAGFLPEDLPDVQFTRADFMDVSWRDYDVVFTNGTSVPDMVLGGIAHKAYELPRGAILLTLDKTVSAPHLELAASMPLEPTLGGVTLHVHRRVVSAPPKHGGEPSALAAAQGAVAETAGAQAAQAPGNAGGYRVRVPSFASNDSTGLHDVDRELDLESSGSSIPTPTVVPAVSTPTRTPGAGKPSVDTGLLSPSGLPGAKTARVTDTYGGSSSPQADALLAARRRHKPAGASGLGRPPTGRRMVVPPVVPGPDSTSSSPTRHLSSPQGRKLRQAGAGRMQGGGGSLLDRQGSDSSDASGNSGTFALGAAPGGWDRGDVMSSPQGRALRQARGNKPASSLATGSGGALRTPPVGPARPPSGISMPPSAPLGDEDPGYDLPSSPQGRALLQARVGRSAVGALVDQEPASPVLSSGNLVRTRSQEGGSALMRQALMASSGLGPSGPPAGWEDVAPRQDGSSSPQADALLKRKSRIPAPSGEVHTPTYGSAGGGDLFGVPASPLGPAGEPSPGVAPQDSSGSGSSSFALGASAHTSLGGGVRHASLRTRMSDADIAFLNAEDLN